MGYSRYIKFIITYAATVPDSRCIILSKNMKISSQIIDLLHGKYYKIRKSEPLHIIRKGNFRLEFSNNAQILSKRIHQDVLHGFMPDLIYLHDFESLSGQDTFVLDKAIAPIVAYYSPIVIKS